MWMELLAGGPCITAPATSGADCNRFTEETLEFRQLHFISGSYRTRRKTSHRSTRTTGEEHVNLRCGATLQALKLTLRAVRRHTVWREREEDMGDTHATDQMLTATPETTWKCGFRPPSGRFKPRKIETGRRVAITAEYVRQVALPGVHTGMACSRGRCLHCLPIDGGVKMCACATGNRFVLSPCAPTLWKIPLFVYDACLRAVGYPSVCMPLNTANGLPAAEAHIFQMHFGYVRVGLLSAHRCCFSSLRCRRLHASHKVFAKTVGERLPSACPARYLCFKYLISSPKFILTWGSPPSRPH